MRSVSVLFAIAGILGLGTTGCDSGSASAPSGPGSVPGTPPAATPSSPTSQPPLPPTPPVVVACPVSTNPIDTAICARLQAAACPVPVLASNEELCRRISMDFTGLPPSKDDVAAKCTGKTAAEMADAFMATPEYVLHEQAHWAQHLRWDDSKVAAKYLVDADVILERLAKGLDGYDVFARKIMAHPSFAMGSRLPISTSDSTADQPAFAQVAENAMKVFLGRASVLGEDAELGKLWAPWLKTYLNVNSAQGFGRWDADLDPGRCTGTIGNTCTASVLGATVTITLPLAAVTRYDTFAGTVPAAVQTELEKPGALLAAQPSFWDEAADHAFLRLTGWWKSTKAEPDTDLPEARVAAAKAFREMPKHDYRELLKLIVTSTLYTRTNLVDPGVKKDPPVYCSGPLKAMSPEDYVSAMGKVVSRKVGRCDFHTGEGPGGGETGGFFPDSLRRDRPADADLTSAFHYGAVQPLGGCRGGVPTPLQPGLGLVFGAVGVAQTLCAAPAVFAPADFDATDKSDANVNKIVDFQSRLFLGRDLDPTERTALKAFATKCAADTACGMPNVPGQLCGAYLRSLAFLYY